MTQRKIQLHYVPQMIIEMAENAHKNEKKPFLQDTYVCRLEAIRDYCIEALEKIARKKESR